VIINIKKVPIRIKILKKLVKELETKLFENNSNDSLKEFKIINIKATIVPQIILVTRT
jgi:hypothetical protein